jgi:uncharacterized peroxidase-related enzyme
MPPPEFRDLPEQGAKAHLRATNLSVVSEAEASPEVKHLYAQFRTTFGRPEVPGILQCFATHPPLLQHMMGLAETMLFSVGALGRANKEMLATFVSAQNHCGYCADSHGFFLRMNGGTSELLKAATTCDLQSPSLSPQQRALLQFAQKLTGDSSSISSQDVERLRGFGWTDLQVAEAVHLAALFACFNRVVNAFGLPPQNLLAAFEENAEAQHRPTAPTRNVNPGGNP